MRKDRRTGMAKLTVAFRDFANGPTNYFLPHRTRRLYIIRTNQLIMVRGMSVYPLKHGRLINTHCR
jgi:hypothetical protein